MTNNEPQLPAGAGVPGPPSWTGQPGPGGGYPPPAPPGYPLLPDPSQPYGPAGFGAPGVPGQPPPLQPHGVGWQPGQQQPVRPTAAHGAWDASGGPLDIKPIAGALIKGSLPALGFAAAGVMAMAFLGSSRTRGLSLGVRLGVGAVIIALALIFLTMQTLLSRIVVSANELTVRNWFGRTRTVARADLAFGVLAVHYQGQHLVQSAAAAKPMALIATSQGRRALMMYGALWSQDQFERVLAALALPRVDVIPTLIVAKAFDRRYPKLLPFQQRHPIWSAFGYTIVLIALIVGVVIATD